MNQDTKEPRDFSQMYYWEVNWPRFFSNRDYVCSRRSKVFKDKEGNDDVIVIFSKSAEHSNYPKKVGYVPQSGKTRNLLSLEKYFVKTAYIVI